MRPEREVEGRRSEGAGSRDEDWRWTSWRCWGGRIFFGVMTKRKRVPFAGQGTAGSITGGFSLGIRYQGPPGGRRIA